MNVDANGYVWQTEMGKALILSFLLAFPSFQAFPQLKLKLSAELRPRTEFRDGFATLASDATEPAFFTSQRTRLIFDFKNENKLHLYFNLQDIRVWGDERQLVRDAGDRTSMHEGWAELLLSDKVALKFGRQEIILDDHRIFGNVGWAQQGRSHDAALLKYNSNDFQLQLGAAFNQTGETLFNTLYELNNYKTLQYLWLNKQWDGLQGSFLFLNNGLQFIGSSTGQDNDTRFSQTIGTHIKNNSDRLSFSGNLYYQFGKDVSNRSINAYLIAIDVKTTVNENWHLGAGFELISGTDMDDTQDNKSFSPFYGTNHKFNGWMDYFYVGNHADNVGLLDVYLYTGVKSGKWSGRLYVHNFSAPADIVTTEGKVDSQLGVETDLELTYVMNSDVNFKFGYSQLFASEGMEALKGGDRTAFNGWSWLMITVKPTLFEFKKEENKNSSD